jgi:hypothetical protein
MKFHGAADKKWGDYAELKQKKEENDLRQLNGSLYCISSTFCI